MKSDVDDETLDTVDAIETTSLMNIGLTLAELTMAISLMVALCVTKCRASTANLPVDTPVFAEIERVRI